MVEINAISEVIGNILEEYTDLIFNVSDKALDAGAKVLIKNLKNATPMGVTKEFSNGWKQKKKYKLKRYVGNTKVVAGTKGNIPLSNITEYSLKRGKPFIKRTYDNSLEQIAQTIINEVKKGV